MPILPANAHAQLINTPIAFLKEYPVRIFGDPGPSAIVPYALGNRGGSERPGEVWGTFKYKSTESFNIRATSANMHAPLVDHIFPAHSIHMDVGAAALGFYPLDGAGPSIMLTGQLSGCSFVISPGVAGGPLNVAHVSPVAGAAGSALRTALVAAHPGATVYGVGTSKGLYDSNKRKVSVLGFRNAGQWTIYAQKQDALLANNYRIVSVHEIYPKQKKR